MQKTAETLSVGTTANIAMAFPPSRGLWPADRTGLSVRRNKKPSGSIGPEGPIASCRCDGPPVPTGDVVSTENIICGRRLSTGRAEKTGDGRSSRRAASLVQFPATLFPRRGVEQAGPAAAVQFHPGQHLDAEQRVPA